MCDTFSPTYAVIKLGHKTTDQNPEAVLQNNLFGYCDYNIEFFTHFHSGSVLSDIPS